MRVGEVCGVPKENEDPLPSPDSVKGFSAADWRPQLREQWPPLLSPLLAIRKNPRPERDHLWTHSLRHSGAEFITSNVAAVVRCITKVSKQSERRRRRKGDE